MGGGGGSVKVTFPSASVLSSENVYGLHLKSSVWLMAGEEFPRLMLMTLPQAGAPSFRSQWEGDRVPCEPIGPPPLCPAPDGSGVGGTQQEIDLAVSKLP